MRWAVPAHRFLRKAYGRARAWKRAAFELAFRYGRNAGRIADSAQAIGDSHDALLQDLQGLILRFHAISNQASMQQPAAAMLEAALDSADRLLIASRTRLQELRDHAEGTGLVRALEEVALDHRLFGGFPTIVTVTAGAGRKNVHQRVIEAVAQVFLRVLQHATHLEHADRLSVRVRCQRQSLEITFEQEGGRLTPPNPPLPDGDLLALGDALGALACGLEGRVTLSPRTGGSLFIALRIPGRIAYDRSARGRASSLRARDRPET
ncbi:MULTISPECIES: hypothetical protein [Sphingomonas]|jgi:hypothetical protein|uniref:hypothetical protein n=1 Tax=Sphingomonas TaxID=13687 RepID=UPI001AE31BB7